MSAASVASETVLGPEFVASSKLPDELSMSQV